MKPVKRVELVLEAVEEKRIEQILEEIGISGYTVYHHVGGKGERGERANLAFGDKFENVAFVIACDVNLLSPLAEAVRPILKQYGGVCLVSDAQWLIHND